MSESHLQQHSPQSKPESRVEKKERLDKYADRVANVDWRAIYKPLGLSKDTQEHIELAKGKEIKRGKDETRGICLAYIQKMTKDSADRNTTAIISEEF